MADFREALAELYVKHSHSVRRAVAGQLGGWADADDVVQDAFMRLLSHDPATPISSPIAFLMRVASNLVADRHRSDQLRRRYFVEDGAPEGVPSLVATPEQQAESRQLYRLYRERIEALPPRCRHVFILHRFHGLPQAEIAQRLGISRNMVEKHMIRALLELRRCRDALREPSRQPA